MNEKFSEYIVYVEAFFCPALFHAGYQLPVLVGSLFKKDVFQASTSYLLPYEPLIVFSISVHGTA